MLNLMLYNTRNNVKFQSEKGPSRSWAYISHVQFLKLQADVPMRHDSTDYWFCHTTQQRNNKFAIKAIKKVNMMS